MGCILISNNGAKRVCDYSWLKTMGSKGFILQIYYIKINIDDPTESIVSVKKYTQSGKNFEWTKFCDWMIENFEQTTFLTLIILT